MTCDWVMKSSVKKMRSGKPVRWRGFPARREMSVRPKNISVSATVAGGVFSGVGRCIVAAADPGRMLYLATAGVTGARAFSDASGSVDGGPE